MYKPETSENVNVAGMIEPRLVQPRMQNVAGMIEPRLVQPRMSNVAGTKEPRLVQPKVYIKTLTLMNDRGIVGEIN